MFHLFYLLIFSNKFFIILPSDVQTAKLRETWLKFTHNIKINQNIEDISEICKYLQQKLKYLY
jgi:hypothetical protein